MRVLGIVFNSNREKKQKRPVEKKKSVCFQFSLKSVLEEKK